MTSASPRAEEMDALVRRGIRFESGMVTGLRIEDDRATGVEVGGALSLSEWSSRVPLRALATRSSVRSVRR